MIIIINYASYDEFSMYDVFCYVLWIRWVKTHFAYVSWLVILFRKDRKYEKYVLSKMRSRNECILGCIKRKMNVVV